MKSFEEYSNMNEAKLYDILGVDKSAPDGAIKKAYDRAIDGASGEHARDIRYAYRILKTDRAEYDQVGDERWFGDKRHRAVRTADARDNSADRNRRQMASALSMYGWAVLDYGVEAGVPWTVASHPRDADRDYLFRYDNKTTTVFSGNKGNVKPDANGNVDEQVPLLGKKGIEGFKAAVKNVTGRIDSAKFVSRRTEMGRFTPPA